MEKYILHRWNLLSKTFTHISKLKNHRNLSIITPVYREINHYNKNVKYEFFCSMEKLQLRNSSVHNGSTTTTLSQRLSCHLSKQTSISHLNKFLNCRWYRIVKNIICKHSIQNSRRIYNKIIGSTLNKLTFSLGNGKSNNNAW